MDLRAGDWAWAGLITAAIGYELAAEARICGLDGDLLSESSQRACTRNPWLARTAILAVAGHLAGVLPPQVDVFSAKNWGHQVVVAVIRRLRR